METFFDRVCRVPPWRNPEVVSDVTTGLQTVKCKRTAKF